MINIFSSGKKYFLTLCTGVMCFATFAFAHNLDAATYGRNETKETQLVSLEAHLPQLAQLAKAEQQPAKRELLKKVLKNAKKIIKNPGKQNRKAINKAFEAVQKVTLKNGKKSCDVCSELSDLDSEVADCCTSIKELLSQLLELVTGDSVCNDSIPINQTPFVITQSGKYCVTRDLVYTSVIGGAAITVHADNVTINFANHSLTLGDNTQGILVENANEFTLENDIIQGSAPFHTVSSIAVHLNNVKKALLDNVYTLNTTRGIQIVNSTDVLIKNSHVQNHDGFFLPSNIGAGILVESSNGITVDNTTFEGSSVLPANSVASMGLYIFGDSSNVTLSNSAFTGWLTSIWAGQVTGLTIEHCQAIASAVSNQTLAQFGDDSDGSLANDIIIRNSSFKADILELPAFNGLYFLQGSGCILENVILDVQPNLLGVVLSDGLQIGCRTSCAAPRSYNNVYARECIIKANARSNGVNIDFGQDFTFSHCQFTNCIVAILLSGLEPNNVQRCQILDSVISENRNGVFLQGDTSMNSIVNCELTNNSSSAIFITGATTGNLVRGNRIFGNSIGLFNGSPTTQTYFNTSCNNTSTNCFGVTPSQTPGQSPAVAGSNVCCAEPGN